MTFRVTFLVSAFRAIIIVSQFQRSEPLLLLSLTFRVAFLVLAFRAITASSFGVPSHHFSVWHSEPSSFSVLVFRAIIAFQFWRSEPSLFSVWRSEPSSLLIFGVQSHHRFSVLAFIAIIAFQFWLSGAFIAFRFRRSEPSSSLLSSAFRAFLIAS